ncbi:hypothetical protein DB32_000248 [Sandaracinus amylolyticus]|uniref:Uncharacterized protein n=1 Tax=Sandaracinus amylolyticus TaxID=927083 RepID=A0A0F6SDA4_9BACT|nr:hypothetical protein DB32_000248 [Sandaracinus amylolyticus]
MRRVDAAPGVASWPCGVRIDADAIHLAGAEREREEEPRRQRAGERGDRPTTCGI